MAKRSLSHPEPPFVPVLCMKIEQALQAHVAAHPGSKYTRTEVLFCPRCINGGTELRYYPDGSNSETYVTFRTEDRPNCDHIALGDLSTLRMINPHNLDVEPLLKAIVDGSKSSVGRHRLHGVHHAAAS